MELKRRRKPKAKLGLYIKANVKIEALERKMKFHTEKHIKEQREMNEKLLELKKAAQEVCPHYQSRKLINAGFRNIFKCPCGKEFDHADGNNWY